MKKRLFLTIMGMIMIVAAILWWQQNQRGKSVVISNLNITNIRETIPKVAITFDDGPSGQYTEMLLDGLKERNVKATFFVMGESVSEHEEIIRRMYEEGHLIGNHTYNHVDLAKTGFDEACKEINETNRKVKKITGYTPDFIRPPYGDWNEKLLEETDMSVVLWTVDPEDWKDQNADIVTARVLKNVHSGDIILLHDIFPSSVQAALRIVDELQRRGYHFVTVDKISSEKIIRRDE